MDPSIHLKKAISLFVVALTCFALSPVAEALVPPPDGDYPKRNTAEGEAALNSLQLNGRGSLDNTALGYHTLFNLTNGSGNTATGAEALSDNVTGRFNTAIGARALFHNTSDGNTANGYQALFGNTNGYENTAVGFQALRNNIGPINPPSTTEATQNTAVGYQALFANTYGQVNTAIGDSALINNIEGFSNTAVGAYALNFITTGSFNTALGANAYAGNGDRNTAIGSAALGFGSGSFNTAIGQGTLALNTGSNNTALGRSAGDGVTTADNVICIGANVDGADVSNSCYIGNIWIQPGGSQAVYVNSQGKLGFQVSSQRFKDEIKPMERVSEIIYALKPVTFRYKKEIERTCPAGFGLIAEDVDKLNHDLVTRDQDGKPTSVHYDAVNAMLLNEFLKEHRKVEQLEKQVEALTAGLQKVNAQLQLSNAARQITLD
jgi:hypothetical protein